MKIIYDKTPAKGPYINVEEAEYVDGYRLRLTFSDDSTRIVDFHDYLRDAPRPWITKYWNMDEFKDFRLLDGDLMWGDFDLVFPVMELYRGKIEYDFPRQPDIPKSRTNGHSISFEQMKLPTATLRRLKARAKKESVSLERLMQRYLEEGMKRHSVRAR